MHRLKSCSDISVDPHLDLHVVKLPVLFDAEVSVPRHGDHPRLGVNDKVVLAPAVNGKPGIEINFCSTLYFRSMMKHSPQEAVIPIRVTGHQGHGLAASRGILSDGNLIAGLRNPGFHVANAANLRRRKL